MHSPPKIIFTERLILRQPEIEDASAIYEEYAHDKDVTKYLTWDAHASVQETEKFLKRCKRVWQEATSFPWTILRKTDHQLMGMIEVSFEQTGAILGFVLGKNFWGNEYMSEAIKAIISWCMSQKDLYRVWAICASTTIWPPRVPWKKPACKKKVCSEDGLFYHNWVKLRVIVYLTP